MNVFIFKKIGGGRTLKSLLLALLFSVAGLMNAQNTENRDGQWYYYDNGEYLGYYSDISEWGIMLPAGSYVGNTLTKVSIFDCNTGNQPFYIVIHYGENEPSAFVGQISVGSGIFTGSMDFVDFACDIPIDPSKNVWIIVDSYMPYYGVLNIPYCTNQGDPNGRWIYSGGEWGIAETSNNFMLRAYFEESTPVNFIDEVYLEGFTAPVWGAQADFDLTVPAGAHYAVEEVEWWRSTGNLTPGDVFDCEDCYYSMEVRLSPEEGYAINPGATVYFNGDATINDAAHNMSYSDGRLKASTISFHVTAPSGDLSYDFEDGTLQGWTAIDADGDGFNWFNYYGWGHNDSDHFATSESYDNATSTGLTPDNYLVSPQVELGGSISFWACAMDSNYPEEHFGVAVSTTNNTDPSAFTTLEEWTITAKRVDDRGQTEWVQYTVDLSAYAGHTGYVAIRHFGCADQYLLNVDDITLTIDDTPTPTTYTITATANPSVGGSVTGGGTFNSGETCTLTATANSGYQFLNWTKNGAEVSASAAYTFTVTETAQFVANFIQSQTQTYTLTVSCDPTMGAVTGNGTYAAGTVVTVEAIAYKNYVFDQWNDGVTDNPRTVTLNGNMTLVAFFKGTGVDENGASALKVYPNPAKESLRIEGLETDATVEIYNSLGMMVKTVNATADEEINISDLPQGIYMIRCGQQTIRFVKTR